LGCCFRNGRSPTMVVRTQCKGIGKTGLQVGTHNVRRYFPRDAHEVELALDHLLIQCELGAEFWQGEAEIFDPRLCEWLESKNFHLTPGRLPVPMALVPTGKNSFRVLPIRPKGPTVAAGWGQKMN